MKSTVRAVAEAALFQAIVYDSKSRKRAIAVYACGEDVIWADDMLSLFDRDKRRPAPDWLKTQLRKLPANTARFNWKGEKVEFTTPNGAELAVPRGPEADDPQYTSPVDHTPISDARGEDLDDESSIRQG